MPATPAPAVRCPTATRSAITVTAANDAPAGADTDGVDQRGCDLRVRGVRLRLQRCPRQPGERAGSGEDQLAARLRARCSTTGWRSPRRRSATASRCRLPISHRACSASNRRWAPTARVMRASRSRCGDNGGTGNGGVDLDPTPNTITIDVGQVNNAPAGADKTVSVNEDGTSMRLLCPTSASAIRTTPRRTRWRR